MVMPDIEFRDSFDDDNYGQQGGSMKDILLRHIRMISALSCKEFTGGFWEEKPVRTSSGVMFTRRWHDDVREAYCNAVDFLIDITYPFADKELKTYLVKFEDYKEKYDDKIDVPEKEDIDKRVYQKRVTFRQINLMFERINFWKGTGSYSE